MSHDPIRPRSSRCAHLAATEGAVIHASFTQVTIDHFDPLTVGSPPASLARAQPPRRRHHYEVCDFCALDLERLGDRWRGVNRVSAEDPIVRHVRELLNEYHHKIGYRTAMIEELAELVRAKLRQELQR